MILFNILLFCAGLLLLYVGAELLVRGSSRIALLLRISPIIVGLTVVAFGTSSPEFLVSFIAAYKGNTDIAIGNIIGSNIANIGLVLAFSALLRPIVAFKQDIKSELLWMGTVSVMLWVFAFNGLIGLLEGAVMLAGIVLFTGLLIRSSLKERIPVDEIPQIDTGWSAIDGLSKKNKVLVFISWTIIGMVVLGYGSKITIDSAKVIALELGVSHVVIGLTMVAFGTSLPELATGIISVAKKENELLVGNVIGSNLFNILAVAGPVAIIFPIPVAQKIIWSDFPVMLIFTGILMVILLWRKKMGRFSAAVLFMFYLLYIAQIVISR